MASTNQENGIHSKQEKKTIALETLKALSKKKSKQDEALERLQRLSKKPKKESKRNRNRRICFKTDVLGNRTFPYAGSNRSKKASTSENVTESFTPWNDVESVSSPDEEPTEISPEIILNLELLLKHKKKKKRKNKSWSQRRNAVEEKWEEHREDILSAVILNNSFDGLCQYCKFEKIAVKCDTCFWKKLCIKCDEKLHVEYPMHNRIGIFDGFKRTLSPSETVDEESVIIDKYPTIPLMPINCQSCDSYNVERIPGDCVAVVTIAGKYYLHLYSLRCKDCDSTSNPFTLENVVGSGFWPSAPTKFSYLFHVETLQFWDTLRKNAPGTSEAAFLEVLNTMTNLHGRKTGKITPAIFSMAFKEWCFCQHKIHILQKKKWIECPSCTHVQHSCHVDGNCKLYRYRSSGRRTRPEFYNGLFIAEDTKVKCFIDEIYKGKFGKGEADFICGGKWNAARNKASTKKSLDVTGLEVMSCRHQLGQRALNMYRGEIYGYPLYLIREHLSTRNMKFVYADIMCKLSKFIKRVDAETANKFTGALSVMHAKGHGIDCQFIWDGKWIDGTGRSTGEETEQIFSYMSRFCNTTKYQKPESKT